MGESAATTLASILVLASGFAFAAYAYHKSYKRVVLQKMTNAFQPGDPVLELAALAKDVPSTGAPDGRWVLRDEQVHVDEIIDGKASGHYYLLIGDKGTGKSSMLIEAMRKIDGEGVAMFEAHSDLEIVRIRLGKALDFEFHEDYIGGYFSERGPRDSTALLDIERALNKLEKVALVSRRKRGKPLVLIINQMHLLRDDEDGKDLIELLQQRAEQWAAANLVTMVFNSDDYWVYERLKQLATRMEVIPVMDLPKQQALSALQKYRHRYFKEDVEHSLLEEIYDMVGGRLSFLNRVAKSKDMLGTCETIIDVERKWFLNQCWILGAEMDDDVMDQQKWAVRFFLLSFFFSFIVELPNIISLTSITTKSPKPGRGNGPSPRPRRQRRRNGQNLRPRNRPHPPDLPLPQSPRDHDALRLHPPARQPQPLLHHGLGRRARQLRAHAPRLQGDLFRARVQGASRGHDTADCRYRESWEDEGVGGEGSCPGWGVSYWEGGLEDGWGGGEVEAGRGER